MSNTNIVIVSFLAVCLLAYLFDLVYFNNFYSCLLSLVDFHFALLIKQKPLHFLPDLR